MEVDARFAHAKEFSKVTGCAPKHYNVAAPPPGRVLVVDGIPITDHYEVRRLERQGTVYRHIIRKVRP